MAALLLATACALLASLPAHAFDARLTRYPYLTDAVGSSVMVNFATDRSVTGAIVRWGEAGSESCTAHSTAATRTEIVVGTVPQYQWKAHLSIRPDTRFCYRVFAADPIEADLLGGDPSPRFDSQLPHGSSESFSFAVMGDLGHVYGASENPDMANVLARIAESSARFALTTGDNAYEDGTQLNYGDLYQKGPAVSAVFGPSYWKVPGASIPLFPAVGNHGFEQDAHMVNWPQDTAVSSSGGRYTMDPHCCLNGTAPGVYQSAWYAFDAGPARLYVLEAAWSDTNVGAGSGYANDYAYHWTPESPQYRWLERDLASNPRKLKFAFFHYPLYADSGSPHTASDLFLRGPGSLQGLLERYGVDVAFTGHAHQYERNHPTAAGLVTYVTGGGGGGLLPLGACSSWNAYAIGWSFAGGRPGHGQACGAAPIPDSKTRVFHFLLVTVNGDEVTVTPTDEFGRTFDVVTYRFGSEPPVAASAQGLVAGTATGAAPQRPASATSDGCSSSRPALQALARGALGSHRRATVGELRRSPRFRRSADAPPRRPHVVRARLVSMRREADGGVRLVIADRRRPRERLSARLPSRFCARIAGPRAERRINSARARLRAACGRPRSARVRLGGVASFVGALRRMQGSRSVASRRVELNPVLDVRRVRCRRAR